MLNKYTVSLDYIDHNGKDISLKYVVEADYFDPPSALHEAYNKARQNEQQKHIDILGRLSHHIIGMSEDEKTAEAVNQGMTLKEFCDWILDEPLEVADALGIL